VVGLKEVSVVLLCYLIGAIPFSYLLSRIFKGVDIRIKGSGNVGATNVLRTSGIAVALAALTGDLLKGILASWIGLSVGGAVLAAICGVAAVIGHCYSIFLGFHGGKGVATAAGIILYLMPDVLLGLFGIFIIITIVSRYVSLASITVAVLLPVLTLLLGKPWPYIISSFFIAALVIYRHKANIRRLKSGNELKITEKVK